MPPNGILYEQRQTGFRSWLVEPSSQWDFDWCCRIIRDHRLANPRFGFTTDMGLIADELDRVNAARVAAIPGAQDYVIAVTDAGAANPHQAPLNLPAKLQHVAAGLSKMVTGGKGLLEWEKSGEPPVPAEQAEARAQVCAVCPKNSKDDLTRWFTVPASEFIKRQIERANNLKLATSKDAELGTCEACLCVLIPKVHTPLKFIHMSEAVKAELDPACWILSELK